MEDVDERDLRLARRLKLGVRLVIYPLLLGLVVIAWHRRAGGGADARPTPPLARPTPPLRSWSGTSPNLAGPAWAQTEGIALIGFRADLVERCPGGATFIYRWTGGPIRQRGAAATVTDHTRGRADDGGPMDAHVALAATVGDRISVRLSGWVVWTRASDARAVRCETAPTTLVLRAA